MSRPASPGYRQFMMIAFPLPATATDTAAEVPALLAVLAETQPAMALAMVHALGGAESPALRATGRHLVEALAADSLLDQDVDTVVTRAHKALAAFESWTDRRIDALLFDIATLLAGRAEELAIAAVGETGLGNVADKILKIRFASLGIYRSLAGQTAQGVLSVDEERRVTEIASPVG